MNDTSTTTVSRMIDRLQKATKLKLCAHTREHMQKHIGNTFSVTSVNKTSIVILLDGLASRAEIVLKRKGAKIRVLANDTFETIHPDFGACAIWQDVSNDGKEAAPDAG